PAGPRTLPSATPSTPNAELHGRIAEIAAELSVRDGRGRTTQRSRTDWGTHPSPRSLIHYPTRTTQRSRARSLRSHRHNTATPAEPPHRRHPRAARPPPPHTTARPRACCYARGGGV